MSYNATSIPANPHGSEPILLAESLATLAAEQSGVAIRRLWAWEELEQARMLQVAIWQMSTDLDAIAPRMSITFQKNGGMVLGAYVSTPGIEYLNLSAGTMVGVYIGFLGFRQPMDARERMAGVYQLAHRYGVISAARNQGIAKALMLHARSLALSQGVRQIQWSFSPQNAACAHLSLHCLGARVIDNQGEKEADQMTVTWDLLISLKQK